MNKKTMLSKKFTLTLLSICLMGTLFFASCSGPSASTEEAEVVETASEQSPSQVVDKVPLIQPSELEELMQNNGENIVLLDTRSPQEYESGHLEDSRFVNFQTFQLKDVQDIPKDAEIVVYCAVGGRSNRVGMQLISAGYENVRNLEGGITNWKNQGQEVVYE